MSGSRYPPRGGDNRHEYDSYNGRRDNNRDGRVGRDRHNDRRASPPRGPGGGGGGDTYRPQQSSSYSHRDNYYNSQDSRRNQPGYDSWAPGTDGYRPPPPSYAQPPPPPPRDAPRPPQGEFSFRVEKPAGVQESLDSYRPSNGSVPQFGQNNGSSRLPARPPYQSNYRGREANRRGRGGRGGRGGFVRFKAAERELLNPVHSNGPEQIFFDAAAGATYRPVEELSDSDEAEMEISEGEGGDDSQEPSHKRARFGAQKSALEDSLPKWSNPDPYTALPPPDAAGKQRKDVVQLIRKARVETKESKASIPAEAADFIPCDFDDSDDDDDIEIIGERAVSAEIEVIGERRITRGDAPGVARAPTGPRLVQPSSQDAQRGSTIASAPEPKKTAASQPTNGNSLPPRPPVQSVVDIKPAVSYPQPIPSTTNDSSNGLGSRKRTYDDEIKLPAHATLKRVNMKPGRGKIVSEWRVVGGENPCPWIVTDHSGSSANPGIWLHKEIVDFYEHIRPQDFEESIRGQLVQQLKTLCRDIYGDAEVYPFGSFPSGLYLPTGDMDLVLCSDSVMEGGLPKYTARNVLYRLRESLVNAKVASYNDVEVIGKARVPLVKFIDTRTGLKVDVSFENLTGLNAIKTFLHWRNQYPEMPVLVTLIKHFLAMRGLNEPVNGGIGGFSVICLVVSMLQHMPGIQSGSKNGQHHYGDLLMDFFDLYGNKFHYETTAISLNPAAYIPKNRVVGFTYKNTDRLSIIDPNNSANDISGGSSNIGVITQLFSDAYRDLRQRMADVAKAGKRGNKKSILEVIFAGNYSTFRLQREHLAKLAERGLGPQPVVPPKQFGRRRNNW